MKRLLAIACGAALATGCAAPRRRPAVERDKPKPSADAPKPLVAKPEAAKPKAAKAVAVSPAEPVARPPVMPTVAPPEGKRWVAFDEMTDEFDGDALDPAKWHPRNPGWKGRQPGFFHDRNVTVSDGSLHIVMKREDLPDLPEGYHTFTCGAVKSKTTVLYGYFETRARAMDSKGSSAFWFYNHEPTLWTEIDVFEIGGGAPKHEHVVHMNAHVFITPEEKRHWSRGGKWTSEGRLADAFHVYALLWTKGELVYYFDGREVRRMPNTHWHQPLHMNFDSETMPKWFGLPDEGTLPSTFSVDYVRSWRAK
ncbi:MAG: family 16 glycosylhydrolase [Planctomycetota bacterium]